MWEYYAEVLRVIDADTLDVNADCGFSIHAHVHLRLDRINAYEVTEPRGIVARTYAANLISQAAQVRIISRKQDKYGRWLAEVFLRFKTTSSDWLNLNDDLVYHSHAEYVTY